MDTYVALTLGFLVLTTAVAIGTNWGGTGSQLLLTAEWWETSVLGIALGRATLRLALRVWRAGALDHRNVALYGASSTAAALAQTFADNSWMGLDVVGVYDDDASAATADTLRLLGGLDDLVRAAKEQRVGAVYLTAEGLGPGRIKEILCRFSDTTISVHYCPSVSGLDLLGGRWDDIFGVPVLSLVTSPFDELRRHAKWMEDWILLILLAPPALIASGVIAILIKATSPGPVLYLQNRYGLGGRVFKIWKFRTMTVTDSDDDFRQAKTKDLRITPFGAFLRKTSLDELPQLMNVLRGEMSIIGPRPAPIKYNEEHRGLIERYMLRHKVKPGMTGLAQVNGCRGETETLRKTWERTRYDLDYIDNWSVWLDMKILAWTVWLVLKELF